MTDVKRNYTEVETQVDSSPTHDDKKLHSKPGRKPVDTEPKSKRTAQNRAAQRAYRERKERKMKDLEDKVKSLEDRNIKALTETDFLKAQVEMLKNELAKYRGEKEITDLNLPSKVGTLSNPSTGGYVPLFDKKGSVSDSATSNNSPSVDKLSIDFPWSKDNLHDVQGNQFPLPDLVSGSSSSTSPLNENILISPESSNNDSSNPNTINSNQYDNFDFTSKFEEQVEPFCVELNEACGNKIQPIPKYKRLGSNFSSPYSNNITPDERTKNDAFFNGESNFNFSLAADDNNNDPLAFLSDNTNNYDISLAFGDDFAVKKEADPVSQLITEESIYDPLQDSVNVDFNFNEFVKSSLPSEANKSPESSRKDSIPRNPPEDNEVVPAPQKTMKCSEIWERITTHPKYTEIDIDGLCQELKSKAKCSEKGVVINSDDVSKLLQQSAHYGVD